MNTNHCNVVIVTRPEIRESAMKHFVSKLPSPSCSTLGATARLIAVVAILFLMTASLRAAVILQADFNGAGGGTGGASDIVSLGGTGTLRAVNTGQTATVETTTPLSPFASGYLQAGYNSSFGTSKAVATVTPSSAASSWASLYNFNGGGANPRLVNGGFDFLFRSSVEIAGNNYLRAIVLTAPSGGGAIELTSTAGSDLLLRVTGPSNSIQTPAPGGGTTYQAAAAAGAGFQMAADTVYHIAASFQTDPGTGITTMRLFGVAGDGAIDNSPSSPALLATTTFNLVESLWTSTDGFATGAFDLGILASTTGAGSPKTQEFDRFRLFNEAPAVFDSAVPEPGTVVLLGLAGLVAARRRRG